MPITNSPSTTQLFSTGTTQNPVKHQTLMKNHLEIYLNSLNPTVTVDYLTKVHFTQQLCEGFSMYLAKTALRLDRVEPTPISLQTCENYFSAFKSFYLYTFGRNEPLPPCMSAVNWASYIAAMVVAKKESLKEGEQLSKPRECASDEDRKALGAICLWSGDTASGEFYLFLNMAYQCAGRGGEIAACKRGSLKTKVIKEEAYSSKKGYEVLQLSMYRPKTRKFTSALIFPDRDSICNDSYFATAYYLVISKHSSDYLLPSFGSKLQKKDGKVNSSKVSTLFKALVTKLYELVDRYIESVDVTHPINEEYAFADLSQTNLTSHCARKSTFNKLAESSVQAHNWMF